jgi:hypothetical protein
MSSLHAPDDDLDERWEAAWAHSALAQVPGFDSPELAERAHANDAKRVTPPPARRPARKSATDEEAWRSRGTNEGNVYDHGPHRSEAERMGHEMLIEEYENSLEKPTEIEIEGSPFT